MSTYYSRLFGNRGEDIEYFMSVRVSVQNSEEPTRLEEAHSKSPTYNHYPARQKAPNIASLVSSLNPRKAERVRRDQIRDSINALGAAQQNEAWQAESQRRQIWDQQHGERKRKADLAGTERKAQQVDDQDSSSSQPRWWKKIFRWRRVKGGLSGQSDLEGNRIPITTGGELISHPQASYLR